MIRTKLQRKIPNRVLVLVVEHDAETQNSISFYLEAAGHNCVCVASEAAARAWLKSSCPDIVLVDMLLPDSDHRQFSKSIQALAPNTKIIVLARSGSNHAVQEALTWGAADYLEKPVNGLRLQCVLKHLSQPRPQAAAHACQPNAFFNGDQHLYKTALSKFKKAIKLNIPIVFEGAPGTGKATAVKHFLQQTCPETKVLWFDARTDAPNEFRNRVSELDNSSKSVRFGIVIQHMEAASKALQLDIRNQLDRPNQIAVATSSGRLMDHMENGILDPELFSKMSAAPFWLAPLSERQNDTDTIGRLFLNLANAELQTNLPDSAITDLNSGLPKTFPDNFSGLKKAVYATAATYQPIATNANVLECPAPSTINQTNAPFIQTKIDLLNAAGQLRSIEAIEADAIKFAFAHLEGRVGKIARALKLGRTTLYRKLTKLKLAQTECNISDKQNTDSVHDTEEKITARAA